MIEMRKVSKITVIILSAVLVSCDVFLSDKEDAKSESYTEIWEGQYGGASDTYYVEENDFVLDAEDIQVKFEIKFDEEGKSIRYFSFDKNYYNTEMPDAQKDPETPNKISKDSLILVDREGKYQTDYLIEKDGQDISGEVRIYEQDSDGDYSIEGLYEFAASFTETE
jgi:hypothetical protein